MHSKWRYKIYIWSVILGKLESCRNLDKGLNIIFRKFYMQVDGHDESHKHFLIPLFITFVNQKILGFHFNKK